MMGPLQSTDVKQWAENPGKTAEQLIKVKSRDSLKLHHNNPKILSESVTLELQLKNKIMKLVVVYIPSTGVPKTFSFLRVCLYYIGTSPVHSIAKLSHQAQCGVYIRVRSQKPNYFCTVWLLDV